MTRLSAALAKLDTEPATPYLPVVNFADGMRSDHARGVSAAGPVDLSVRLSHVLLALTLDYESRSQLSLPLVADVLVHLGERDTRATELVAASGVSKVAINALLGFLQRRRLGVVSSRERRRLVRLTGTGMEAREQHLYTLDGQRKRHRERYGAVVDELSAAALASLTPARLTTRPVSPKDCGRCRVAGEPGRRTWYRPRHSSPTRGGYRRSRWSCTVAATPTAADGMDER